MEVIFMYFQILSRSFQTLKYLPQGRKTVGIKYGKFINLIRDYPLQKTIPISTGSPSARLPSVPSDKQCLCQELLEALV